MIQIEDVLKLNTQWVFFDFYDTIISRDCSASDLKKKWCSALCNKYRLNISPKELYDIRIKKEVYLESRNGRACEFKYEQLANLIFEKIRPSMDKDKFIVNCKDTELDVEVKSHYLNNDTLTLIKELKANNKKIAIVSDTYLSKKDIRLFLEKQNVEDYFDDIFVSCEFDTNKRRGNLYHKIISKLNISSDQCVMIGDNKHSDYDVPMAVGIKSFCVSRNYPVNKIDLDYKKSILLSIYNEIDKSDYHYASYVFLLYLFIYRLNDRLLQENLDSVYFFAREGEFLKKIFDVYNDKFNNSSIESKYLYVSRKATYTPTLNPIDREQFDTIFREYPDINISSFLMSIGFDKNDSETIIGELEKETNKSLHDSPIKDSIVYLRQSKYFIGKYDNLRSTQNKLFLEYLGQQDLNNFTKKAAVVDVGWKGTIQDNICKLFKSKVEFNGYYIGISSKLKDIDNNHKTGLIFSSVPKNSKDFKLWSFNKTFLERLLHASHPSTDGYVKVRNGVVEPILIEYDSEKDMYISVKALQDEILHCFSEICDIFIDEFYTPDDLIKEFKTLHKKALFKANKCDFELERNLRNGQFENFGYIASFGENSKEAFSVPHMVKSVLRDFKKLFDFSLICSVLLQKKMYGMLKLLYMIKYLFS